MIGCEYDEGLKTYSMINLTEMLPEREKAKAKWNDVNDEDVLRMAEGCRFLKSE